ncbi:hypothetical protein POM88_036728 [Heracleum sosnowskyi]|uniref:Uncharacterized protein n=1 Tax=Heracleum sosnowskyi TaxID=360622 RepID=A0AAD8MEK9_9APIA|nr:hypothetical protein POM88_036728 [Heracleum sosnowskyi]
MLESKKVVEGNDNNGYFPNKKSDPFVEEKTFDGVRGKKRSRKCFDLSKDDQDFEYSEKEKKPRTICNARHKVFKVASPLPVVFKNEIQEMGGTDVKLIIQKNLFSADTEGGQNRFSIPMKQIRENFLTDEEESILDQRFKDNHVVPLMVPVLIEPNLEKAQINFRKWAVNSSYVLSSPWNEIRDRNDLMAKMEMQLWSFRVDGALNFSMVKVSDGLLCHNFVEEYRSSLPQTLYLQVVSGEIWEGRYMKGSKYIKGLLAMMELYKIRPYHMVILTYHGGPNFDLEIFNECAVEIRYPLKLGKKDDIRLKCPGNSFVTPNSCVIDIDKDKMAAALSFNCLKNFVGLVYVVLGKEDFISSSRYEILCHSDLKKMILSKESKSLEIGFELYTWTINITWLNGKVFLTKADVTSEFVADIVKELSKVVIDISDDNEDSVGAEEPNVKIEEADVENDLECEYC